jgi:hypothetical protein
MSIKVIILIVFLLFVLALSAGCSSPASQTTQPSSTETNTTTEAPTPAPTTSSASSVSLEELRKRLLATRSVFVADVDTASALAGYSVATPSYIPDGFIPVELRGAGGSFNVFTLARSIDLDENKYPYSVTQKYSPTGDSSTKVPYFQISQSRNRIGSAHRGGPVQIGEYEGEKALLSDLVSPQLNLTWNDGTMYYFMASSLLEPLDEATLIQIAASMEY